MAAVIAIPDDLFQEIGHAFVLLERNQTVSIEELRTTCKANLANYKIPKHFTVRRSLPMLSVGKIDKQRLKEMAVTQFAK
jgi:acyl-CoA synthetase (AMP-forming)/AMP-acid ligase II